MVRVKGSSGADLKLILEVDLSCVIYIFQLVSETK